MRTNWIAGLGVGVVMLAAGCGEPPPGPEAPLSPTFAKGGNAACPTPADFVVSNEADLLAALTAASPGDVIGLDGFFEVTATVFLSTDDITLTCATAESGVFAQPGAGVGVILWPSGERVTIDRLVVDGTNAARPINAQFTEGVRVTNNTVTCGTGNCTFFHAVPGGVIKDNYYESHGSISGVHVQAGVDGTRIEGNTIVAAAPQTFGAPIFGGIRARDGSNVLVAGNEVRGPWHNSIHAAALTNSQFKSNRLEGSTWDGILLFPFVDGNVFRNNKATGHGEAGIFAYLACDNTFIGNNLNGNANNWGAVFAEPTGANTLVGNQNVVIDDGDFDCDGDGEPDPNIITGKGAVEQGVKLGEKVSDAASSWKDLK